MANNLFLEIRDKYHFKGDPCIEPFMYIMTSIPRFWDMIDSIYDFDERRVKNTDMSRYGWMSSGEYIMINIAFNLFNGNLGDKEAYMPYHLNRIDDNLFEIYVTALHLSRQ